jgi:hypothetical protein
MENANLKEANRKLILRERNTEKLENCVERLTKDKKRLLELMRDSKEFRLLGNLGAKNSEITFLHGLGLFSDYDVDKIQLTNKNKLFKDEDIRKFNDTMVNKRRGKDHRLRARASTVKGSKTCSNFFNGTMQIQQDLGGFGTLGNHLKIKASQKHQLFSEEQLWVDKGIRDFAMEMKDRLNEEYSEELMDHLLLKLNSHFISKINVFRKSGHLFCKLCSKGKPKKQRNSEGGNMNFIKTLKNYCNYFILFIFFNKSALKKQNDQEQLEINKLKCENNHLKSRLKKSTLKKQILNECFSQKNNPILNNNFKGIGNNQRQNRRFRKSLGRLVKVNSHLVHMMNFDKENYFLNLKRDTEKCRVNLNLTSSIKNQNRIK